MSNGLLAFWIILGLFTYIVGCGAYTALAEQEAVPDDGLCIITWPVMALFGLAILPFWIGFWLANFIIDP